MNGKPYNRHTRGRRPPIDAIEKTPLRRGCLRVSAWVGFSPTSPGWCHHFDIGNPLALRLGVPCGNPHLAELRFTVPRIFLTWGIPEVKICTLGKTLGERPYTPLLGGNRLWSRELKSYIVGIRGANFLLFVLRGNIS